MASNTSSSRSVAATIQASTFALHCHRIHNAALSVAALAGLLWQVAHAQDPNPALPQPYRRIEHFFKLPPGRTMGSSSAVAVDHKGHIWVVDRCETNSCAGSTLDPIMEFDSNGVFIKAFGGGRLLFPHGFFIDRADHLWVTDGHVGDGKGDDVLEFDQSGKLLRTLGKPGVSGNGPDTFHEPNAVLVAPDGAIFVSDGHEAGQGNARVVKFDSHGRFLTQWGGSWRRAGAVRGAALPRYGLEGSPVRRRSSQQSHSGV